MLNVIRGNLFDVLCLLQNVSQSFFLLLEKLDIYFFPLSGLFCRLSIFLESDIIFLRLEWIYKYLQKDASLSFSFDFKKQHTYLSDLELQFSFFQWCPLTFSSGCWSSECKCFWYYCFLASEHLWWLSATFLYCIKNV